MTSEKDILIKNVIRELIGKSEDEGFILLDDLIDIVGSRFDDDQVATIVNVLENKGIEILEMEPDDYDRDAQPEGEFQHSTMEGIGTEDTVGLYLKEMSLVPLLTFEEEVTLAKQIEQGKIAETTLQQCDLDLTIPEQERLEIIIQQAQEAWQHLIKANTRLVVSVAKKFMSRGVGFLDLIQEGNLGLIKAVDKYDYTKGFRFSTYATWWIRQSISRCIADQGRTIRIPVHMIDRLRQLYKVSFELEQVLNRKPTSQELAEAMNMDIQKVDWMVKISWLPVSLDSPVGDDEDSDLAMFVEDEMTPSPLDTTFQSMLRDKIDQVLMTLPNREANILRLRFGLDNGRAFTLEEVGKKFCLTRERIRQLEGKALRRLRNPKRSSMLKDYLQ